MLDSMEFTGKFTDAIHMATLTSRKGSNHGSQMSILMSSAESERGAIMRMGSRLLPASDVTFKIQV